MDKRLTYSVVGRCLLSPFGCDYARWAIKCKVGSAPCGSYFSDQSRVISKWIGKMVSISLALFILFFLDFSAEESLRVPNFWTIAIVTSAHHIQRFRCNKSFIIGPSYIEKWNPRNSLRPEPYNSSRKFLKLSINFQARISIKFH